MQKCPKSIRIDINLTLISFKLTIKQFEVRLNIIVTFFGQRDFENFDAVFDLLSSLFKFWTEQKFLNLILSMKIGESSASKEISTK